MHFLLAGDPIKQQKMARQVQSSDLGTICMFYSQRLIATELNSNECVIFDSPQMRATLWAEYFDPMTCDFSTFEHEISGHVTHFHFKINVFFPDI